MLIMMGFVVAFIVVFVMIIIVLIFMAAIVTLAMLRMGMTARRQTVFVA